MKSRGAEAFDGEALDAQRIVDDIAELLDVLGGGAE